MTDALQISWLAIGPEIVLTAGAVVVLLVDVFRQPSHRVHAVLAALTLGGAGGTAWVLWGRESSLHFSGMVIVDEFAVMTRFAVLAVAALGLAAGWGMIARLGRRGAEGIALVLLAAAGFQFMGSSGHFLMVFLGLEVASLSLYVLAGITREEVQADEAALKYFLLGSFASAIFVYGIALTYAATGRLFIAGAGQVLQATVLVRPGVLLLAMALVVVGLAFKISAAPFHAWAPDVYQGAPAGLVGFMAAAAKIGAFAALMRILNAAFGTYRSDWAPAIAALATISIVVGTLLAIAQSDMRRLLAYSGVAHAGFILTGLVAGAEGAPAVWFYLLMYTVQLVGAFAVVAAVGGPTRSGSPLADYSGLAERAPLAAGVLSLLLLALAGLPLTSGFVAKFGVFSSAWRGGYEWLVVVALLASVAGFFFYIRVIVLMYMQAPSLVEAPGAALARPEPVGALRWVLIVAAAVTIAFGLFPKPLLDLVGNAFPL